VVFRVETIGNLLQHSIDAPRTATSGFRHNEEALRKLMYMAESEIASSGKCVVGTVKGDLHDIGRNLVTMMLDGGGFEAIDLGIDLDPGLGQDHDRRCAGDGHFCRADRRRCVCPGCSLCGGFGA
jgi:hypothetical protein